MSDKAVILLTRFMERLPWFVYRQTLPNSSRVEMNQLHLRTWKTWTIQTGTRLRWWFPLFSYFGLSLDNGYKFILLVLYYVLYALLIATLRLAPMNNIEHTLLSINYNTKPWCLQRQFDQDTLQFPTYNTSFTYYIQSYIR